MSCCVCMSKAQDVVNIKKHKWNILLKMLVPEVTWEPSWMVCRDCYTYLKKVELLRELCLTTELKRIASLEEPQSEPRQEACEINHSTPEHTEVQEAQSGLPQETNASGIKLTQSELQQELKACGVNQRTPEQWQSKLLQQTCVINHSSSEESQSEDDSPKSKLTFESASVIQSKEKISQILFENIFL